MAKRTIQEIITNLENRRDSLEDKIEEVEQYKALEGQGSYGARTEFTDLTKLEKSLEKINNKLSNLYRQIGV